MAEITELTRWRLLWLMLRTRPRTLFPESLAFAVGVGLVTAAGAALVHLASTFGDRIIAGLTAAICGVCLFACAVVWWPRFGWRNRRLSLVDHPRLRAVVREAVELAGWDRAPTVRVRAWAVVLAWRGRWGRGELMLGLPQLVGLRPDELRAVIVRELLHCSTLREHERHVLLLNDIDVGRAMSGRPNKHRARLREHALRLRRDLWTATADRVGRDVLARATRRETMVDHAFGRYLTSYVLPVRDSGHVADLYRHFRWKIADDGLLDRMRPAVDRFVAERLDRHDTALLEEFGWKAGEPVDPVTGAAFQWIPDALERSLARVVQKEHVKGFPLRSKPLWLGEFDPHLWREIAAGRWESLFTAMAALLGRTACALDAVRLARDGRAAELDWWHTALLCAHPTPGVCVLVTLLDVELRARGYVHTHPVRHRLLTGPLGDTVDVVELAGRIERGQPYPFDLGGAMTGSDPDADARRLAAEHLRGGDATGWFERLYAGSATGDTVVPWDAHAPHPLLVEGALERAEEGGRALVVGAGLGDDAEYVARLGYDTVAFDVSPSAVRLAKRRFPGTTVDYRVADLFDPPAEWGAAFDLVVEVMTVQSLPEHLHGPAIERVAGFVRPGGTLIVIASARDEGGPVFAPPWPLTPAEIGAFAEHGLVARRVEELREPERRRWRATFGRPSA
ncbi:methyltransferase domain-containing protein [Nonomuraea sp. NPDC047897]|uniref:methyltransferase domain-containing protein n=1 Tax=Nonomuraea sp. NPDC047897 TaxID=3364346 RepID=UPI00371725DE